MFDAPPPSEAASTPAARRERTLTARSSRSFSDDTLEGLIDRSMDATLQTASDVKTLVDMLQLLLQRYRVQLLRLQNEVAATRAERSQVQRAVERQREEAEAAAWDLRRQLERESAQARARLTEELAALRTAAEEEARRIRLEAEREAAALLAAAQARRTELLAGVQPWRQELDDVRARLGQEGAELPPVAADEDLVEPAAASPPAGHTPFARGEAGVQESPRAPVTAAPGASPPPAATAPTPSARPSALSPAEERPPDARPAAADSTPLGRLRAEAAARAADRSSLGAAPARAAAPAEAAEQGATTEVVFLRVPDTRRAMALQAAVAGLPGVTACHLREFERGRLALDVEHSLGSALAERLRGLSEFDLRLTNARDGYLELQVL